MDALLVIDVQKALLAGAYREKSVLSAIQLTVNRIRKRGGIIVYIQHCHDSFAPLQKGSVGWSLHEELDVREEDFHVEKTASDAFYRTQLDEVLRGSGVDHVYLCGLQTEFCVDASCRSALSKDYSVTLVSDAHTTGDALLPAQQIIDHHQHVLSNLAHPALKITLLASVDV